MGVGQAEASASYVCQQQARNQAQCAWEAAAGIWQRMLWPDSTALLRRTLTSRGAQQARLQLGQQCAQLLAPLAELRQAGGWHPGGQRRLCFSHTLQQLACSGAYEARDQLGWECMRAGRAVAL